VGAQVLALDLKPGVRRATENEEVELRSKSQLRSCQSSTDATCNSTLFPKPKFAHNIPATTVLYLMELVVDFVSTKLYADRAVVSSFCVAIDASVHHVSRNILTQYVSQLASPGRSSIVAYFRGPTSPSRVDCF
jgi:hypothetical protein